MPRGDPRYFLIVTKLDGPLWSVSSTALTKYVYHTLFLALRSVKVIGGADGNCVPTMTLVSHVALVTVCPTTRQTSY